MICVQDFWNKSYSEHTRTAVVCNSASPCACVRILISWSVTIVRKDNIYLLTAMNIYKKIINECFTKE